jgi:uncharacterized protein (TIGR02284 family)
MQALTYTIEQALDHLIEVSRDSERTFAAAAAAIGDEILQAELMQYSTQRCRFRGDLESMMRAIEADSGRVGRYPGVVRQRGVHPSRPLPGCRQEDVIAACEMSEKAAAQRYDEALRSQLPSEIENMIASQYRAIKSVQDRIRSVNGVVADA